VSNEALIFRSHGLRGNVNSARIILSFRRGVLFNFLCWCFALEVLFPFTKAIVQHIKMGEG